MVLLKLGIDGMYLRTASHERLAALVVSGLEADALVLLTNVGGLLR